MSSDRPAGGEQARQRLQRSRGRERLRGMLAAQGALRSPRWMQAFGTVPRDAFVPRIYSGPDRDGQWELTDGHDADQRDRWLDLVYRDEPLVTEVDGDGRCRSSSSQPSLMAEMLEALDVTGPERVLEAGTGTGFNAGLLCEGLRSSQVTSIDVSAELVASAGERLERLGYSPVLAVADGTAGYAPAAPYDRIIATCSVPAVPSEWVSQSTQGGLILVGLHRELGGGALAVLRVAGDCASGHFAPFYGGFMPDRAVAQPRGGDMLRACIGGPGDTRAAGISLTALEEDAFGMIAALRLPGVQRAWLVPDNAPEQAWLVGDDGSWAYQEDGSSTVTQGGPRRLWDLLEEIYSDWQDLGCPRRQEYGLTVTADGEHLLWHGSPGGISVAV